MTRLRTRLTTTLLITALIALPLALSAAEISRPQPSLPTEPLVITGQDGQRHTFTVEVAKTPGQQEVGLMFRTSVAPDAGMIFDWGTPRQSQMWMRNTLVPLDMVFIAADGTIRHIAENTVPHSLAIIDGREPVLATLELAAGVTAQDDIRVGDKVTAPEFGPGK